MPSLPRPLSPSPPPTLPGREGRKTRGGRLDRSLLLPLSFTNHSLFSPAGRVEGWEKRAGVMRATATAKANLTKYPYL
jgi:hypothetical protein